TAALRKDVLFRNEAIFKDKFRCNRCAQRKLMFDHRSTKSLSALLDDKPANLILVILRPDNCKVRHAAIGDPGFASVEEPTILDPLCSRFHSRRIGAEIGLSQSEASDLFPCGHVRKKFAALLLAAKFIDWIHAE